MYTRTLLMKRTVLVLGFCSILLIAQTSLHADVMIQDIIDSGTGYEVGNLTFSDFSVTTVTTGTAIAPNADGIRVIGKVLTDGRVQLDFTGAWTATGLGATADTKIRFKVSSNDGLSLIAGNELGLTSANVQGNGFVLITENVYNGHPSEDPNAELIGDKLVAKFSDRAQMKDSVSFDGEEFVWVEKDISLADLGGDDIITLSHLSGFYQNFTLGATPTPEPGTLGVLTVGTLGLLARRFRRKR